MTAAETGDGRIVVIHHGEPEADNEDQCDEVREVESALLPGRERCLDAVPDNENSSEGAEQTLPHAIEDSQVLLHERIDSLKHGIEEVHGISLGGSAGPSMSYGKR
jgi:hypothetical protein